MTERGTSPLNSDYFFAKIQLLTSDVLLIMKKFLPRSYTRLYENFLKLMKYTSGHDFT